MLNFNESKKAIKNCKTMNGLEKVLKHFRKYNLDLSIDYNQDLKTNKDWLLEEIEDKKEN